VKNVIKILTISILASVFVSCTSTNEEDYFEDPVCDSALVDRDTIVVYYDDLTYIFSGICQQCHSPELTYRQGIIMDSYENVVSSINTGKVLPAIMHEGSYKMPNNLPKLSDCEIQKIDVWIERGMPENK